MTEKDFFDIDFKEDKIDIKAILFKYLNYWHLLLLGIVVVVSCAFVYLKTKNNLYDASAKIQVLDNKEAPSFSLDLKSLLGKSKVNLDNEIAVLKSRRIVEQVVKALELNVSYFAKGSFIKAQIFNPPFKISHILPLDSIKKNERILIEIKKDGYLLKKDKDDLEFKTKGFYYNGENPDFPIIIDDQRVIESDYSNLTYTVVVQSLSSTTNNYVNSIRIAPDGKNSDLLKLSIQTQNGSFSKKIINTLVDVYEKDGIKDRQKVFKRTIEFVDERFEYLLTELNAIEQSKKEFKQNNKVSVFEADAGLAIQNNSVKEEQLFLIETQLELGKLLKRNLKDAPMELLPSNIGINSDVINQLTTNYNSSLLEFDKLKISAGKNNPSLKVLKKNIEELRANISKSINGYVGGLEVQLNRANKSQIEAENYFTALPQKEQVLRDIDRQQNLKESLYLLLLQKREESAINYAVTVSNVKVIDYAVVTGPIAPNKLKIYIIAVFIGALMPIIALYLKFLLNTKITFSNDIEAIVKSAPVLGTIPLLKNDKKNLSDEDGTRSFLKEAFRTLLTNVKFMIPNEKDGLGKILLVTSSIKGEGKTLVSYNLASEASNHKGKVVLIGADLRNPQLHKYLDVSNVNIGLSSYLNDDNINLSDLEFFHPEETPNLDILFAGAIPPNPTSLLSNNRFEELLDILKKTYDYIIIDSAPTLLVSDTLIFGKLVDTTVYVTRSNYTEKSIIEYSKRLVDEKKLNNVAYVLNGVDKSNGYGYNYNYAYSYSYTYDDDEQNKKWYHFFKR